MNMGQAGLVEVADAFDLRELLRFDECLAQLDGVHSLACLTFSSTAMPS